MNTLHYVMSHLKAVQMKSDERGVTAIEYALIDVVIIAGATSLGSNINSKFSAIATTVGAGLASK